MIKRRWLVAIAACLLMTSCKPKTIVPTCVPLSNNPIDRKSDSITTIIQVDGTPSMQGFTKNFTNSRYAQTLDLLDRASTTTWKTSIVQYFRFGTTKQQVNRQTYLQAKLPEFYTGDNPVFRVSQIENAIAPAAKDRISIIVTDLYQKDSDTNLVLKKLKEDYLQKGYAIGILAIRSEFDGIIYDVGIKNTQFPYSTQGKKTEQFRPFYVLVLGSYGNISSYFDEIKKTSASLIKDEQFVIFYPQVVGQASAFQQESLPDLPSGIRRLKTINDGKVLVKVDEQPIEIINITKNPDSNYSINYQAPYNPLPYTLPIEPAAVAISSVAQSFDPKTKDFQPSNSSKALELNKWKVDKNNIGFVTKINSNDLDPGVHLFTIDVIPQDLKTWGWWQTWNSNESSFDGAKTNNLLPFFQGLKSLTIELITTNKASIGRFCYAIKKN
ncbi:MAG: hypothetical protein KME01_10065 [Chroococcus sp. CMT-3BRIN-NPC107]|jgi:hypothetical protein|nr:hypothetical protein [Chroococcus sp. CMT-3BRIN-NPC107]